MIRSFGRLLLVIGIFLFVPCVSYAKRINVHTLEELMSAASKRNNIIVVRNHIDLEKNRVVFVEGCVLRFRSGSFSNGILVGNHTVLKNNRKNVFHDCTIAGTWQSDYACSSMFNVDMETMQLLRNMSCLSPTMKLSANRNYLINAQQDTIQVEVIEADGKAKPAIAFHTTAPNISGVVLMGRNVTLRNLVITDDYDEKNDAIYGENKPTIGNTIVVKGPKKVVESLSIEGCEFHGGTSSSWVASSQTKNCVVENCTFTGYMADHGVYCSMKTESFVVENSTVIDVWHTTGIFKMRTSQDAKAFIIKNVKAHNLNGYLAHIPLQKTPTCKLLFDKIIVTKDLYNESVFYGFCINDETNSSFETGYNAKELIIRDCFFNYGYNGNAVVYSGSGSRAYIETIKYLSTYFDSSNFGGCFSDNLIVSNCTLNNCCSINKKGIEIMSKYVCINDSKLSDIANDVNYCLFLINYSRSYVESFVLKDVVIDVNTKHIFNVIHGDNISLKIESCFFTSVKNAVISAPSHCNVDYNITKSCIESIKPQSVITFRE